MRYMEKFENTDVLIELDDSTFLFGRIVNEDEAFLTMMHALTLTPDGRVYANKKIVVKRDIFTIVANSKIFRFRKLAVERHVDKDPCYPLIIGFTIGIITLFL